MVAILIDWVHSVKHRVDVWAYFVKPPSLSYEQIVVDKKITYALV